LRRAQLLRQLAPGLRISGEEVSIPAEDKAALPALGIAQQIEHAVQLLLPGQALVGLVQQRADRAVQPEPHGRHQRHHDEDGTGEKLDLSFTAHAAVPDF